MKTRNNRLVVWVLVCGAIISVATAAYGVAFVQRTQLVTEPPTAGHSAHHTRIARNGLEYRLFRPAAWAESKLRSGEYIYFDGSIFRC